MRWRGTTCPNDGAKHGSGSRSSRRGRANGDKRSGGRGSGRTGGYGHPTGRNLRRHRQGDGSQNDRE